MEKVELRLTDKIGRSQGKTRVPSVDTTGQESAGLKREEVAYKIHFPFCLTNFSDNTGPDCLLTVVIAKHEPTDIM